jgi:ParG
MHISISVNLKKQFHAACALRGLKMSQVVAELIEQWLKANDGSASRIVSGESLTKDKVMK